jgi:hypothetical protein
MDTNLTNGYSQTLRTRSQNNTNCGIRDVVSELIHAEKGIRELLLQSMGRKELLVRNTALDGVARCICKAAAAFDSNIKCESSWSKTTVEPCDRASISPKVAVGWHNGAAHFMELCWNKDLQLGL